MQQLDQLCKGPGPRAQRLRMVSAIDFAIPAAEPWYVDTD